MMARPIAPTAPNAGRGSRRERSGVALTYDDIPARLRPSAWRKWLDEVPLHPTTDDERDAAYSAHGWVPNPYASTAKQSGFDPGPVARGWRGEVARARQYDAYAQWCHDKGLVDDTGRILPAWRWSAVRRDEQQLHTLEDQCHR